MRTVPLPLTTSGTLPSAFVLLLALGACTDEKPPGGDTAEDTGADSGHTADSTDTTGDSDTASDSDTAPDTGMTEGRYFPDGAVWYQDVSGLDPDPRSERILGWLEDHQPSTWMQMDFSLVISDARTTPGYRAFTPTSHFYSPDCDREKMPVPEGALLEGESGLTCTHGGDCHLLVPVWEEMRLYEMWKADVRGDNFRGGCLAIWDMSRVYGPEGRGMQCSSADAAGFPIAPLLFTADEVAAGEIRHALRFALPNELMLDHAFTGPATHAGSPSGPADAPPYGAHLRLRADYPLDRLPNDAARTIARALQTYGMFLADGGNITIMGESDHFADHTWAELGVGSHDLMDIRPTDFEVMPYGEVYELTYDCVRAD